MGEPQGDLPLRPAAAAGADRGDPVMLSSSGTPSQPERSCFTVRSSVDREPPTGAAPSAAALPILVIAIIGHRGFGLRSDYAYGLIVVAVAFGAAAIALSAVGATVIWDKGYLGAGNAVRGMLFGLVAVLPAVYFAWGIYNYPRLYDVSTDIVDPPQYRSATFARMGLMNSTWPPSAEDLAKQRQAFPDIVTRRFTIGSDQLFTASMKVVERLGWELTDTVVPKDESDRGRIEAVARSPIVGFQDDVVIRIYGEPTGSRIDLRSSRWRDHDLGSNARRIRGFLQDLDVAVAENFGN